MTNLPSFFTTAGLKVPADSNPSPLGETMGSWESRAHFPSGKAYGAAAMAAMATRRTIQAHAKRLEKFVAFVILRILLFTSCLDRAESLHDESPVADRQATRSEEHTSELQSPCNLVCRLLLEKKKKKPNTITSA